MAKKIDCSELSKEISEIAMNIGSRPGVRNLDDVLAEMHKFPELQAIRREDLVNAIAEASAGAERTRDELAKKLDSLKREAKKDKKLRAAIHDLQKGIAKTPRPPKRRGRSASPAAILRLQAEKAALESKVDGEGVSGDLSALAQQMARQFVALGITERNALVAAVHGELSQAVPDLTPRQVADAISGYGQFKSLSQDEISLKLRDLKGQLQQVAKLEDMAAGQAPAKTGIERREPSDEERRLIKEVNEAKKKGGFAVTDPARQLKSALESIKTRLRHQISDLQRQINSRQKDVKTKTPPPRDAEVLSLIKERDALAKQYSDIFGKPGLTDAQRIEIAKRAVEKSIAEYERKLAESDFAPKPKTAPVSTPELVALRKKRDNLKERYKTQNPQSPEIIRAKARIAELEQHLRDGTVPDTKPKKPTKSPVLASLQERSAALRKAISQSDPALRKRYEKSIGEMLKRLEEDDFILPTKKETVPQNKELEMLQYQRDRLRRQIRQRIESLKPKTVWQHIAEPFNAARAIITSVDFSAVLRQGGFISLGNPVRSAKSLVPMFKAFRSDRLAYKINEEIQNRPNAPLYARAKLYLAPMDGSYQLTKKEEAYMSRWAEKIPLVRASERAYITFLNKLRADSFDTMVATLGRNGDVTQQEAAAIANFINVATGRGNAGSLEPALGPMAQIFFSPRLVLSRFQLLAMEPAFHGTARTRKLVAKEYSKFLIGVGVVYALGMAAGGDIEDDPRSSDFGKIRFGNARVDPLGGLAQVTVFMSRLATGELKSTRSGKVYALRGEEHKFGMPSVSSVVTNFVRSKASPIAGAAWNILAKENVVGENTDVTTIGGAKKVAADLVIPMSVRDIYEALVDQGIPKGTAMGLLSIFGFSLQVYESEEDEKKKK